MDNRSSASPILVWTEQGLEIAADTLPRFWPPKMPPHPVMEPFQLAWKVRL